MWCGVVCVCVGRCLCVWRVCAEMDEWDDKQVCCVCEVLCCVCCVGGLCGMVCVCVCVCVRREVFVCV